MLGIGKPPPTCGWEEKGMWLPRAGTSKTQIVQVRGGVGTPFSFISRSNKGSKRKKHVSITPVRCASQDIREANPEK